MSVPPNADRSLGAPERERPTAAFETGRFVAILALAALAMASLSDAEWFRRSVDMPALRLDAWVGAALLNSFGEQAMADGNEIVTQRFQLSIWPACGIIQPLILYLAAVVAVPVPAAARWVGALSGIVFAFLLNQVRILSLYYIGLHWPDRFDSAHTEVWQGLFIGASIVAWGGWSRWAIRRDSSLLQNEGAARY